MIRDIISNACSYKVLGQEIAFAFDYLTGTDFSGIAPGRYELRGQRVFAIVQRYQPRTLDQAIWEAHRRYIDIQYIADGIERMGYRPLSDNPAIKNVYDIDKDVEFFHPGGDLLEFRKGDFAVFTPQDIHAPGLLHEAVQGDSEVLKVVVKVHINKASGPCGF